MAARGILPTTRTAETTTAQKKKVDKLKKSEPVKKKKRKWKESRGTRRSSQRSEKKLGFRKEENQKHARWIGVRWVSMSDTGIHHRHCSVVKRSDEKRGGFQGEASLEEYNVCQLTYFPNHIPDRDQHYWTTVELGADAKKEQMEKTENIQPVVLHFRFNLV